MVTASVTYVCLQRLENPEYPIKDKTLVWIISCFFLLLDKLWLTYQVSSIPEVYDWPINEGRGLIKRFSQWWHLILYVNIKFAKHGVDLTWLLCQTKKLVKHSQQNSSDWLLGSTSTTNCWPATIFRSVSSSHRLNVFGTALIVNSNTAVSVTYKELTVCISLQSESHSLRTPQQLYLHRHWLWEWLT